MEDLPTSFLCHAWGIQAQGNYWGEGVECFPALELSISDAVTKRYAKKAVLLPSTASDIARTDYDTIKHYFDDFLKTKPQG